MKKFLLILLCFFLQNTAFAENFYIENYNINLKVNEDKSVNVTEEIQVQFTNPSHGIIRTIPHRNASISNVQVNNSYSTSYENSELNLKIGNSDIYVNGRQDYNIKYRYTILDTKNEFYFNIIGTEWPVKINNAKFTVTMPKDFDFNKAGLSIGEYGTAGFKDNAFYQKKGNSIHGEITKPLNPHDGITIRIEVPDGYFTNEQDYTMPIAVISGLLLLTLISSIIWFKYGKDEHVTPTVTFYPPENINSLEAEMVYKENASEKGLVALLTELAGKGYVKIDYNEYADDFFLTKIAEYDGKNAIERDFLKAIFPNTISETTTKTLEKSTTFYQDCTKLVGKCNKNKSTVFEDSSINFKNRLILILCNLAIMLLTIFPLVSYNIISLFSMETIFPLIAFIIFLTQQKNIFITLWSLSFGGIPLGLLIHNHGGLNTTELTVICIGIVCLIISFICYKQISKKNKLGQIIMSKLLGLKNFIEVAEKNRLESLVKENPDYFYNILPYAYILGVSDKWIKQLESIISADSQWYCGNRFSQFTNRVHSAAIPTTTNGGISSRSGGGGGFSGGGFGGGGGGSW